jgi:4-coumarate--CoA ligase
VIPKGLQVVVQWAVVSGVKTVVMSKFDIEQACRLIQDETVSIMYIPPPIVLAFQKHPVVSKYDLSSLKLVNSGAAPLTRDLVNGVFDRLKIGIKQGYGMSEMSPTHIQQSHEWARAIGSVGKMVSNMESKFVDEKGNELPDGEVREIFGSCLTLLSGTDWVRADGGAADEGT